MMKQNCTFIICSNIIVFLLVTGLLIGFIILSAINNSWFLIPFLCFIIIIFGDLIGIAVNIRCRNANQENSQIDYSNSNDFIISIISNYNFDQNVDNTTLNQNQILNQIDVPPSYESVTTKLPSYEQVINNLNSKNNLAQNF